MFFSRTSKIIFVVGGRGFTDFLVKNGRDVCEEKIRSDEEWRNYWFLRHLSLELAARQNKRLAGPVPAEVGFLVQISLK